jgi:hypothetical protein
MFRRQIFDYMRPGEELVQEPFERLIEADELLTHQHDGFTASMDTFKDKQHFDELYAKGRAPWEVWRKDVTAPRGISVPELRTTSEPALAAGGDKVAVKYAGAESLSLLNLGSPEIATGVAVR